MSANDLPERIGPTGFKTALAGAVTMASAALPAGTASCRYELPRVLADEPGAEQGQLCRDVATALALAGKHGGKARAIGIDTVLFTSIISPDEEGTPNGRRMLHEALAITERSIQASQHDQTGENLMARVTDVY